jgi:TIR domain
LGALGKIFISYRREDAPGDARSICDRLTRSFGEANVFMDVDRLLAGQRFDRELDKALSKCDVLVAVIGTRWTELLADYAQSGKRDYVRDEIAAALKRDIIVIPVMIGREGNLPPLPLAEKLPEDIRELVLYQKHNIAHETFGRDAKDLVAAIKTVLASRRGPSPWRTIAAMGVIGLALVGISLGNWMDIIPRIGSSTPQHSIGTNDTTATAVLSSEEKRAASDESARKTAADEAARKDAEEAQRQAEADAVRKKTEEEARFKAEAEAKAAKEAAELKAANDAAAKKKAADDEAARKAAEATKAREPNPLEQIAPLPPETAAISPEPSPQDLARSVQSELKRVGCFAGSINGEWDAVSRSSLDMFNKLAGTKLDVKLASIDMLNAIRSRTSRICPLICEHGYKANDNDACTKIACKVGYEIGDKNECERIVTKKPLAAHETQRKLTVQHRSGSVGAKCFSFGGKSYCE